MLRIDPLGLFCIEIGLSGGNGTVGGTVGVQLGSDGMCVYGGYGIGLGGSVTVTVKSGSPQEGTTLNETVSGGNGVFGGQGTLQGDTKGKLPISWEEVMASAGL
jgi:hypothetical protein